MESQIEMQLNQTPPNTSGSTRSLALVPPPEQTAIRQPMGPGEVITPEMAEAVARLIQAMHLDYGLALPREQELPLKVHRWALLFTRCKVPPSEIDELYNHVCADRRGTGKYLDFPPAIHSIIAKYEEIFGAELRRARELHEAREMQGRAEHWSKQPVTESGDVGFGDVRAQAAANAAKAGGH